MARRSRRRSKGLFQIFGFVKSPGREEVIRILMEHPLLEELRAWSTFKSKAMKITDHAKYNMSKYYMGLLFSDLRETTVHCINHYDKYGDNSVDINNLITDSITRVKEIASDNGVPAIFLDKISNYLYKQTKILMSTYADVYIYEQRNSPITISTTKLDTGLLLVRCIASQIEDVINNMNGELHAALMGSVFDK